ncbi:hypothetical protein R2H46_RS13735 [Escherichia coli]|nr:hypothetical protein [Escherichia coli]
MNLKNILALSRSNKSRSCIPAMTNAQLSAFFGDKPARSEILNRMKNRNHQATRTTL